MSVSIIPLTENHLDAMVEIEASDDISSWDQAKLSACFDEQYQVMGLTLAEQLIGYIIFRVILDEAEIIHFAIHPDQRRCGYGYQLLEHVMALVFTGEVKTVFLEVRESNRAAIILYTKLGFEVIGQRENYYKNETALVMCKQKCYNMALF